MGYQNEKYVRNISKYLKKYSDRPVNEYDNISKDENLILFDLITQKMTDSILSVKFKDMGNKIISKRDAFLAISVEEQGYVILQILNILHANAMLGDLTNIGLSKQSGRVGTSVDYSSVKGRLKIINQSITGLFENEYVIK